MAPTHVAIISAIISLVGLLAYAFSGNEKAKGLGERAFVVGLLAALLVLGLAGHR